MTYEYACEACGHQWEAEQSIKDPPLRKCVSCGKAKAKRLVSGGTGFLLKGGGWYADGYGNKRGTSTSPGDAPASKPADSGGGGDSGTTNEGTAKKDAKAAAPVESPGKQSSGKESSGKESSKESSTSKADGAATPPTTSTPSAKAS